MFKPTAKPAAMKPAMKPAKSAPKGKKTAKPMQFMKAPGGKKGA